MKLCKLCSPCEEYLNDLSEKNGGIIFCSHEAAGNTSDAGVLVTIIPPLKVGDRSVAHIIYPCTGDEALEHRREILCEISGEPGVMVQ